MKTRLARKINKKSLFCVPYVNKALDDNTYLETHKHDKGVDYWAIRWALYFDNEMGLPMTKDHRISKALVVIRRNKNWVMYNVLKLARYKVSPRYRREYFRKLRKRDLINK